MNIRSISAFFCRPLPFPQRAKRARASSRRLRANPPVPAPLCIHQGVALFAGAATIPEMRRRGAQGALLRERMRYAFDRGCHLAMMVAAAGSDSQRNAERNGFQIAYTR